MGDVLVSVKAMVAVLAQVVVEWMLLQPDTLEAASRGYREIGQE